MRGLQRELDTAGINLLLLNVQEAPGNLLLERFAFEVTPTYIIFDEQGNEVARRHTDQRYGDPTLAEIETALGRR